MNILLVVATPGELAPIAGALGPACTRDGTMARYTYGGHTIDALTTGVGMVATAAHCSRTLARTPYELALNVGVCGSFDRALEPGTAVHVVCDRLAELGAEDDERFLTIQEMRLLGDDEPPFVKGALVNAAPPPNAALGRLPAVRGITVNTVHGNDRSIAVVVERFQPQIESMEGAAFMYASLIQRVPFAQVRVVSNLVERRNRQTWKLAEAIARAGETALSIIDHA
jgi:futalosine hydrolase